MEDLFVQEPAIAADISKKEKSTPVVEKKNEVNMRRTYSHDEAVEASIEYFKGDELAARGMRVAVTGLKPESEIIASVIKNMKSPAINLCRTRNAGKVEFSTLAELLGGSFHSPDDFLTLKLAGMPCVYIKQTAPLTFYPLLQNHGKFQISNQDKKSHRLKFQLAFPEASKAETQFLERDIIMNPESETSFIFDYTIKRKYQNYEFRIVLDEKLFFLQKNKIPSAFSLNSPGTIFGSGETLTLFLDSAASYPNKYSYRIYLVINSEKLLLKDKIPFTAKARAVIKIPETSGNAVSLKIQMLDSADNPVDELERPVTIMTLGK